MVYRKACTGPITFLIYINDPQHASFLHIILFGDDTVLFQESNNNTNLPIYFYEKLRKVETWLNANKILLNKSKSKYMLFLSSSK